MIKARFKPARLLSEQLPARRQIEENFNQRSPRWRTTAPFSMNWKRAIPLAASSFRKPDVRSAPQNRSPSQAILISVNWAVAASRYAEIMVSIVDIEKPGGWMVRASLPGGSAQTFYVYELDDNKAAELARSAIAATIGEAIETVKLLNVHELTGYGMKPGDVKQYI